MGAGSTPSHHACSVQATSRDPLAPLFRALVVAAVLGQPTLTATLDGRRITIDLEDVEEYLDGEIDREALEARWRTGEPDGDLRRLPDARGDDR
jgi:hypothetical protein